MIKKIKKRIRILYDRIFMICEYYHDYREYKKWNYNNPSVKTQSAQEAKILRQTHIIEKGLSLSNPRKGFGEAKIEELLLLIDEYIAMGFSKDGIPFRNALCVLNQYVLYQRDMGYENQVLNERLADLKEYMDEGFDAGIAHIKLEDLQGEIHGEFPEFFNSRHSIRQFENRDIDFADVQKAVQLAMKAPTACNRQACKVYYYESPKINKELGDLIAGNTGFENEVKNYLVITADMSAFYDTFERNQVYIEAGIFAMALMQSLHYYGIGSCALQNGELYKKNRQYKQVCGNIPDSEKIAIFIAIGYYKNDFSYAISKRKRLEDVLINL